MHKIIIAEATPNDVYPIRSVQRETWIATYPNKEFGITIEDIQEYFDDTSEEKRQRLEERKKNINVNPLVHTWIAKVNEKIVGFVATEKGDRHNRLQAIYILPSYQKQGIGKKFMDVALQWFGNEKPILVNVASYNIAAIDFYKSYGFKENSTQQEPKSRFSSGAMIPETVMILEY